MEEVYNQLNIFLLCKMIYLTCGSILLVLSVIHRQWAKKTMVLLHVVVGCAFLYHIFGFGLRWYVAGYVPLSNLYETMVFVSLILVLTGVVLSRQSKIVYALAVLFGGVILFMSGISRIDPEIGLLAPVLKSPWLIFHVSIIIVSYGFFGIGFLIGCTNLMLMYINKKRQRDVVLIRIKRLTIINEISLWMGLSFLTVGTILGAIWANESWGRYWGWDPKETWALITIMAYTAVTHYSCVLKKEDPKWLNLGAVLAFICVLMTYFGVNFFLSGMHSYG